MIYFFSAIFIAIIYFYYRKTVPEIGSSKRYLLLTLRAAAAVVVLIYLLNPVLRYIQRTMIDPQVVILEDRSMSMDQKAGEASKSQLVSGLLEPIDDLYKRKDFARNRYAFADGLIEKGDSLRRQSTRLEPALEQLIKSQRFEHVNRILLASDGWLQDENLDFLRKLNVPIDVFIPEYRETDFDLEITSVTANREAFIDEIAPIAVEAGARDFEGEANITLLIDKKEAARKTISFRGNQYQEILFEHRFQNEGLHLVEVRIDAIKAQTPETNLGNNLKPTGVSVTTKRKDILVLTDNMGWDLRFIKNALQLDRHWNLDILRYQKGMFYRDKYRIQNPELAKLNYHLLIVINHGNLRIPAPFSTRINEAVQQGSGLWTIGYPVLEEILPANRSNIQRSFEGSLLFTEEAAQYETFAHQNAASIPPVDYLYTNPKLDAKLLGIISNEQRSPAILFRNHGQGKALYFAFLNLWKWQMWNDDGNYNGFCRDIVSWLTSQAKDRFQAIAEPSVIKRGEDVRIRLYALDETMRQLKGLNPKISITGPDSQSAFEDYLKTDDDGYNISFRPETPGKYTFSLRDEETAQQAEGSFVVTHYSAELADRGFNEPLLRFIANESGGQVYTQRQVNDGSIRESEPVPRESFREVALYRKYWLLAIFLICYGLELLLRKRWGLL